MKFLVISSKQLRRIVAEVVEKQVELLVQHLSIKSKMDEDGSNMQPTYLTTDQTLTYLHISKPTLNKLRRQGLIHGHRVGEKRVLYERRELEQYLKSPH